MDKKQQAELRKLFKSYVEGNLTIAQLFNSISHLKNGPLREALGKKLEYLRIYELILTLKNLNDQLDKTEFDLDNLKERVRAVLKDEIDVAPTKKQEKVSAPV